MRALSNWPVLQSELAPAEVDRGAVGWVQKGLERSPNVADSSQSQLAVGSVELAPLGEGRGAWA